MEISKIIKIIANTLNVDPTLIKEGSGPGDLEAWDSLGHLRVLNAIEESIGTTFEIDQVLQIETVSDIFNIINGTDQTVVTTKSIPPTTPASASTSPTSEQITPSTRSKVITMPQFGVRQYRTVPDVLIGVGALNSLQVSQDSKVLIITGNKSYAHELESTISGILSKYTSDILIINKAKGEPNKENINQALKKIRSNQFDKTNIIIAAGGGSVLDSATLLRTKIQFNEELETWSRPFSLPKASQSIPIISIPTTHGSGAEVSSAVAWSPDAQGKQILLSHEFLSHQVILDGSLSTGLPRQESCNTALDALTHAIEGFFSTLDHPIARPLAIPAMKSILKGLPKVLIDPNNSQYRQELLEASYNAGIVQNHCSVGLVHSISHQLSRFGFSHGYLNGKFLVPVLTNSFEALNHKSNQLARQMGYTDRFDLLEELEDLIKLCQLPNLASSDILFEDNKSTLISDIKSDITFRTHPVKVSDTEIDEILTKVVN